MRLLVQTVYRGAAAVLVGSNIERFGIVRRLNDAVAGYVRQGTVKVNGHTLHLDPRDSLKLSALPVHEPAESGLMARVVRPGDTVVDVGSHIGYHTLELARLVGAHGRVYAFEADPDNFALLQRNIRENGYDNIVAENKAVSNSHGVLKFYRSSKGSVDHRIAESEDCRPPIEIECVSLDDYFNGEADTVDFIKMDIQGAEIRAFDGMSGLLQRSGRAFILTEYWPYGLATCGGSGSEYFRMLQDSGFAIYSLEGVRKPVWRVVDEATLAQRYTVENERFATLFCTRDADWSP